MSSSDAERIERSTELYSPGPGEEADGMLKEAIVGGQSVVFTRYAHQIAPVQQC